MGRPSKYKPEFAAQAAKLCALGATDKEVADFFEVHEATLNRWKSDFPEFCESLKTGKAQADERVERALYHRAIGYKHDAVKFSQSGGAVIREDYVEHYPPDTTAAIFWLKNRRSQDWRDKTDVNHSGVIGVRSATEYTDDELASIATGGGAGAAEAASGKTRAH